MCNYVKSYVVLRFHPYYVTTSFNYVHGAKLADLKLSYSMRRKIDLFESIMFERMMWCFRSRGVFRSTYPSIQNSGIIYS